MKEICEKIIQAVYYTVMSFVVIGVMYHFLTCAMTFALQPLLRECSIASRNMLFHNVSKTISRNAVDNMVLLPSQTIRFDLNETYYTQYVGRCNYDKDKHTDSMKSNLK